MNDRKQLDCQLNCKATASCDMAAAEEMNNEDRPLIDLLGKQDERIESEDNEPAGD
jgi:hypothetical protein